MARLTGPPTPDEVAALEALRAGCNANYADLPFEVQRLTSEANTVIGITEREKAGPRSRLERLTEAQEVPGDPDALYMVDVVDEEPP